MIIQYAMYWRYFSSSLVLVRIFLRSYWLQSRCVFSVLSKSFLAATRNQNVICKRGFVKSRSVLECSAAWKNDKTGQFGQINILLFYQMFSFLMFYFSVSILWRPVYELFIFKPSFHFCKNWIEKLKDLWRKKALYN